VDDVLAAKHLDRRRHDEELDHLRHVVVHPVKAGARPARCVA
jgi:hypothetical protein